MRGRYFRDISIVRAGGESNVPLPEADEVVVYRSFMKAGLRFPLDSMLVEVLKTFKVYIHQLTPEAIIGIGVYIWAMRSQGQEPNAKYFCNLHEFSYEAKAIGKEQYHNNFGCYGFVTRSEVSNPVPTFRKRWLEAWMQEWFYVKNDLAEREDIKGIIQRPIWSHFSIRRPSLTLGNDIEACQAAYNTVCTYIGTRDLVQEHIAYKVWPLGSGWEMSKEVAAGSSQSGLIYLKYTFKYRCQFDEPNDDWLDAIDATSDELLGAYSRAEDDAMTAAFGGRGKKQLNRVIFDVIGFVYPDYCYPSRKQGKKIKVAASALSTTPKVKKVKVLTHWPRYIETTKVLKLAEGPSSAIELSLPATTEAIVESAKEPIPKTVAEQPKTAMSLLQETELPKVQKIAAITPKGRRMANVLDAVMESTKVLTPASVEAPSMGDKNTKKSPEISMTRVETEVESSAPAEAIPVEIVGKHTEPKPSDVVKVSLSLEKEKVIKEPEFPAPEASTEELEFIVRHAVGKKLTEEQIAEARQYAKDLKYPVGSLVYSGTDEDDFLYCLPDNKEISVCQEMAKNMGLPKLELGLSAMSKDELVDNLAYNSLKVYTLLLIK
jgi:hypothetical protein